MRRSLVVLGGTGDLTGRLLLPSLACLAAAGTLGVDVEIRAVGQEHWDNDRYRDWPAGGWPRSRPRSTEWPGRDSPATSGTGRPTSPIPAGSVRP